ncbi:ankyrin repeat domain-containing protein 39-like [Photinus pyralis]|nr:ankyrin repeat domain-containing protein 39-like [Photinus pyralis]XP_031344796.1 ankyrin repeat domain-containing protein 39-like [Photinus pyralis]
MSNCEHSCDNAKHTCVRHSSLSQTLDELDFERGVWPAAQFGDLKKVQKLINNGVDVDLRDSAGYTSLHYAARNGHLDVCKFLIQSKADINAVTRSGRVTALHRACTAGQLDVVNFLIECKANIAIRDSDGKTVLHRAAQANHLEISKILTSAYPELKLIKDNKGKLPEDYIINEAIRELFNV